MSTAWLRRLAAVAALALASTAAAQDPTAGWFRQRRAVSATGRHYVVLRRAPAEGLVTYAFVRRGDDAPPIDAAWGLPFLHPADAVEPDLGPEEGDTILAEGTLDPPPLDVRVLDHPVGAVLFEQPGALGRGPAVALLRGDGTLAWSRTTAQLLSTPPRPGTVWWEGWWPDEGRGRLVVCAKEGVFREVDLADGTVTAASADVLRTRFRDGPVEDRERALELALRHSPKGLGQDAAALLRDGDQPPGIRVRAAVAAHRAGRTTEDDDLREVFKSALWISESPPTRAFAAGHAGEVLGEEALRLLRTLLRNEADETWRPALESMHTIGRPAIPVLLGLLQDERGHLDSRGGAAHVLGLLCATEAVPALWKAADAVDPAGDPGHYVATAALEALIAIAPPDLDARLRRMLDAGTPLDAVIARHYTEHPEPAAAGPLVRAMARRGEFAWERRMIVRALRAVTGEDHGNDVAAWRKAVAGDSDGPR